MDRKIRRQTKVKAFEPKLDVDEFNQLTDLLFELLKQNHSACARVLGISRSTWKMWERTPPGWPWWNLVLRHIIKHYITALRARRGLTGKHRKRVMDMMSRIPEADDYMGEIEDLAYNIEGAGRYLRDTLAGKGMFWDELRKPANSGGYTEKTLRKAARMIGVVKRQEGYGEDKRSYWRLPNEDDDDE